MSISDGATSVEIEDLSVAKEICDTSNPGMPKRFSCG